MNPFNTYLTTIALLLFYLFGLPPSTKVNEATSVNLSSHEFASTELSECNIEFQLNDPMLQGLADGDTIEISCQIGIPTLSPGGVTATSDCSTPPEITLYDFISLENSRYCERDGFLRILQCEWRAVDACGNECTLTIFMKAIDDTPPKFTVPSDITLDCTVPNAGDLTITGEPTNITDDCSEIAGAPIFQDETIPDTPCDGSTTILRTWQIADDCGNVATKIQKIVLLGPPLLSGIPEDLIVECHNPVPLPAKVVPNEACAQGVTLEYEEVRTDFDCSGGDNILYTLHRTWTTTNNCGETATHTQVITIKDRFAPTISGIPADEPASCDDLPRVATSVRIGDGCDDNPSLVFSEAIKDQVCIGTYTLIRSWEAADNCGNTTSVSQRIFVSDNTPPVFVSDLPTIIYAECLEVPAAETVLAEDNCDPNPSIEFEETLEVGDCPNAYQLYRVWTATDDCGNTSSFSQTVHVDDTTSPIFTNVPADETIECDQTPPIGVPTVSDNCDENPVLSMEETIVDGDCPSNYHILRTWTLTDACGNTATATQQITVEDSTPPILSGIPTNITLDCTEELPNLLELTASATDNCSKLSPIGISEAITPGECPIFFLVTRTWTVRDECGNEATEQQIITVIDDELPVVTCSPLDLSMGCTQLTDYETIANQWNADNIALLEDCSSDNCGEVIVSSNYDYANLSDSCGLTGTLPVTYTVSDECGNFLSFSVTFSIEDNIPPTVTCNPIDLTLECQEVEANEIAANQWDTNNIALLEACSSDDCGDVIVTSDFSFDNLGDDCGSSGAITVNYTISDECGNNIIRTATFSIIDNTPPVVTCELENLIHQCNGAVGNEMAADNWHEHNLLQLNDCSSDDCSAVTVSSNYDFDALSDDCGLTGMLTVTYTIQDACGNAVTKTANLTIIDSNPPTASCAPTDIVIECRGATENMEQANLWNMENLALLAACTSDECGKVMINSDYNFSNLSDECGLTGSLTVIYTLADECGNSTTLSATLKIEDTTEPTLEDVPADATVSCEMIPEIGSPTATDLCDTDVEIIFSEIEKVASSRCANACYELMRTWTAKDDCGNETMATQIICVIDTVGPVFSPAIEDITIHCDTIISEISDVSDLGLDIPTAIDNCSNLKSDGDVSYREVGELNDPSNCDLLMFDIEWAVMDECGNITRDTQKVTIIDTIAPVFINFPADTVMDCSAIREFGKNNDNGGIVNLDSLSLEIKLLLFPFINDIVVVDNCDPSPLVGAELISSDFQCYGTFTFNCIVTAIDFCGNIVQDTQIIEIIDTTAPVFTTFPADTIVDCQIYFQNPINTDSIIITDKPDTFPFKVNLVAEDNCVLSPVYSFEAFITDSICDYSFTVNCIITAMDFCGNFVQDTQRIQVVDSTSPTFFNTSNDFTVSCEDDKGWMVVWEAFDNCSAPSVETFYTVSACSDFTYVIQRQLIATDACGNQTEQEQNITVFDPIAPIFDDFSCPSRENPDTVTCLDDIPVATFSDCSEITVDYRDNRLDDNPKLCGLIRRCYTVTDHCGNQLDTCCYYFVENEMQVFCNNDETPAIIEDCADLPTNIFPTVESSCDYEFNVRVLNPNDTDCETEIEIQVIEGCRKTPLFCKRTIRVVDAIPPEITCPPDTVIADETALIFLPPATAMDNCDTIYPVVINASDTRIGNMITRKWTATDLCGNTTECEQKITIGSRILPNVIESPMLSEELTLKVFPNPIEDNFFLDIQSPEEGEVLIQLYDLNGQSVKHLQPTLHKGANKIEMEAATLPSGMYFLSFNFKGKVMTRMLPKVN